MQIIVQKLGYRYSLMFFKYTEGKKATSDELISMCESYFILLFMFSFQIPSITTPCLYNLLSDELEEQHLSSIRIKSSYHKFTGFLRVKHNTGFAFLVIYHFHVINFLH